MDSLALKLIVSFRKSYHPDLVIFFVGANDGSDEVIHWTVSFSFNINFVNVNGVFGKHH